MTMTKRFGALFAILGITLCCTAAPQQKTAAATGSPAPELDVAAWVQGKEVKLAELKDKKYAVLFFWTISKDGTEGFPILAELANEYQKKDVVFAGIGIDPVRAVREFELIKSLPFSIAADDKLTSVNLYMRERDRVPMAALIDKNGALVWRGAPDQLGMMLKETLAGRYDIKKAVQREVFADSVTSAMRIKDYPTVLRLLDAELTLYPDNQELITHKTRVLGTLLGKPDDALSFLKEVQSRQPKNLAIYELALHVLKDAKRNKDKGPWIDLIIENFGDKPAVLIQFARSEMNFAVSDLRLENVLKLCRTAYNAPKFQNNTEKGMAAEEYARILYYCGRPDKALVLSKEAMVLLQNTAGFEQAKASVVYYSNVIALSKQIK